jgi:hypothetical protein
LSKTLPSAAAGDDHAGRLVVGVALELAARGDIGILADIELLHGLLRQQRPVVEVLDVDGIVRCSLRDLLRRRAALLGELLLGPASGHDDPGPRRLRLRGTCDFRERFLQRRHADPVGFGAEGQRGADAVNVAVGEAGNHGAAAEVDHSCVRACELFHRTGDTGCKHPIAGDGDRLAHGEILVDGDDLAIE